MQAAVNPGFVTQWPGRFVSNGRPRVCWPPPKKPRTPKHTHTGLTRLEDVDARRAACAAAIRQHHPFNKSPPSPSPSPSPGPASPSPSPSPMAAGRWAQGAAATTTAGHEAMDASKAPGRCQQPQEQQSQPAVAAAAFAGFAPSPPPSQGELTPPDGHSLTLTLSMTLSGGSLLTRTGTGTGITSAAGGGGAARDGTSTSWAPDDLLWACSMRGASPAGGGGAAATAGAGGWGAGAGGLLGGDLGWEQLTPDVAAGGAGWGGTRGARRCWGGGASTGGGGLLDPDLSVSRALGPEAAAEACADMAVVMPPAAAQQLQLRPAGLQSQHHVQDQRGRGHSVDMVHVRGPSALGAAAAAADLQLAQPRQALAGQQQHQHLQHQHQHQHRPSQFLPQHDSRRCLSHSAPLAQLPLPPPQQHRLLPPPTSGPCPNAPHAAAAGLGSLGPGGGGGAARGPVASASVGSGSQPPPNDILTQLRRMSSARQPEPLQAVARAEAAGGEGEGPASLMDAWLSRVEQSCGVAAAGSAPGSGAGGAGGAVGPGPGAAPGLPCWPQTAQQSGRNDSGGGVAAAEYAALQAPPAPQMQCQQQQRPLPEQVQGDGGGGGGGMWGSDGRPVGRLCSTTAGLHDLSRACSSSSFGGELPVLARIASPFA